MNDWLDCILKGQFTQSTKPSLYSHSVSSHDVWWAFWNLHCWDSCHHPKQWRWIDFPLQCSNHWIKLNEPCRTGDLFEILFGEKMDLSLLAYRLPSFPSCVSSLSHREFITPLTVSLSPIELFRVRCFWFNEIQSKAPGKTGKWTLSSRF